MMKRIMVPTLLLLVPVFVNGLRATGHADTQRDEIVPSERWEYLVLSGPSATNFSPTGNPDMRKVAGSFAREGFVLEQHLDKLGEKGWELVSIAGPPNDPVYYFKRRK